MISISLPVAYAGGVLTAFLPCTFPVILGYAGLVGASGSRTVRQSLLFFLLFAFGFSLTYALLGFFAGYFGSALLTFIASFREVFFVTIGLFFFALGLMMFHVIRVPDFSFLKMKRGGIFNSTAPILGAFFALGWTPCIGPVLGALLILASQAGGFGAALLLFVFSLGVMTPLALLALFKTPVTSFISRHPNLLRGVEYFFGAVFFLFGYWFIVGFPAWFELSLPIFDNLQYSLLE